VYTAPSVTTQDKTAASAAVLSGAWSGTGNHAVLDAAMVQCTTPGILRLYNFGFAGQDKWRLDSLTIQELHARNAALTPLMVALEWNGQRASDWVVTDALGAVLADVGTIELATAKFSPEDLAEAGFGIQIRDDQGGAEIDYVVLRAGTQRWDTAPMWENPSSQQDGVAGRVCTASHIWFPGSMLRFTEQGLRGEPFAGEDD
jgi:hypothetical protein